MSAVGLQAGGAVPDAKQAELQAAVARVYDVTRLHRIEITIAAEDAAKLTLRTEERIRATFTFDGVTLKDVGVRQAGGPFHPYRTIGNKPSLSLKFNEFVKGQELHGLEKMVLKNETQDLGLLNEHMTYEVFRRGGLAAPMTAHATVTINGVDNGIYLMREPVNEDFLVRNFGSGNETGNLYELEFLNRDILLNPQSADLKDEKEEGRNRDDLLTLAATVQVVPEEFFIQAVTPLLDLDRFVRFFALEAVTSHFDGFAWRNNNTYLYTLPSDKRFVFIPHGADTGFWASMFRVQTPYAPPLALLARKILAQPALAKKYGEELARASAAPVWDTAVLLERVAQVGRILEAAEKTGRTGVDLGLFAQHRPVTEEFIRTIGPGRMARPGP